MEHPKIAPRIDFAKVYTHCEELEPPDNPVRVLGTFLIKHFGRNATPTAVGYWYGVRAAEADMTGGTDDSNEITAAAKSLAQAVGGTEFSSQVLALFNTPEND